MFKASKKRTRRIPERIGKGLPITPSAALEIAYKRKLNKIFNEMIKDYSSGIKRLNESDEARKFFAQDSISGSFISFFKKIKRKWDKIFSSSIPYLCDKFVDDVEEQATISTLNSLKTAGIKQPTSAYNSNVRNTINAAKDFNYTLINNISEDVHNKIYEAVMLSLTSPNPEQQGTVGIENALKDIGGFTENKIRLISKDQTSKLYASLSDERLIQNGVEEFIWMHSSAGKIPRIDHLKKDGKTFKINDPSLWEGNKSDVGPPGWAINCRCRKIPVI